MTQDVDDKWTCVRHRCVVHYDVPAQNLNEAHGSECGGCIAADRDSWKERAFKAEVAVAALQVRADKFLKMEDALKEQMANTYAWQKQAEAAEEKVRLRGIEIGELKAEWIQNRIDTRRLNWLDTTQFPDDIGMGEQLKWQIGPYEADNLRDAIDGAMKEWFGAGEPDNT